MKLTPEQQTELERLQHLLIAKHKELDEVNAKLADLHAQLANE